MKINDYELLLSLCPYVFHFIKDTNLEHMTNGKYNLDKGIILNIETYNTDFRDHRKFESHKKYIDVQYIIDGREIISICPACELSILEEYDEKKDISFFKTNNSGIDYLLNKNDYLIIPSEEPHMPCIAYNNISNVKKAVFKIPVPIQNINKSSIKYLVLDVDGTLTDGKIYLSNLGDEIKSFDIKDGYAIKELLYKSNIEPIIITGRSSKIVEKRCYELGITKLFQGVKNKYETLKYVVDDLSTVAYMGDDDNDLNCMQEVKKNGGIVGCPRDSSCSVLAIASFVSYFKGGEGAVRDFIEWLLNH